MEEAKEVALKTGGMQAALTAGSNMPPDVQSILDDPEVVQKLQERNKFLSKFHFNDQAEHETCEELR